MIEVLLAIFGAAAFGALSAAASATSRITECERRIRTMAGASANILARAVADLERLEIQVAMLRGEHKPETPSEN